MEDLEDYNDYFLAFSEAGSALALASLAKQPLRKTAISKCPSVRLERFGRNTSLARENSRSTAALEGIGVFNLIKRSRMPNGIVSVLTDLETGSSKYLVRISAA